MDNRTTRGLGLRVMIPAVWAILVVAAFSLTAGATDDGLCQQSDGQWGMPNGGPASDENCITEAEYAEKYAVPALVDAGVFEVIGESADGVLVRFPSGAVATVISEPLSRSTGVSPAVAPDAPTVGEVYEGIAERVAAVRHITLGGPQEL